MVMEMEAQGARQRGAGPGALMGAAPAPEPRTCCAAAPGDPRGECPAPTSPSPTAPVWPCCCRPPSLMPLPLCVILGAPPGPALPSLVFSRLPPFYKMMSESVDQPSWTSCFARPYRRACAAVWGRFVQAPPGHAVGPGTEPALGVPRQHRSHLSPPVTALGLSARSSPWSPLGSHLVPHCPVQALPRLLRRRWGVPGVSALHALLRVLTCPVL